MLLKNLKQKLENVVKFYLPSFLPLNNTNANKVCVIQKKKNKRKWKEVSRNI